MPQELARGANCQVPSSTLMISVACATPVDVSALLVAGNGKVRSDADLIFYNQPTGPGVQYLSAATGPRGVTAVTITTQALPDDVDRVAITASLDGTGAATFGAAGSLVMTVIDASGADAVTATAPALTSEAALIVGEVYRRGAQWKVRSVMQGFYDGLAGIATEFGVDVDADVDADTGSDAPAAVQVVPPPVAAPLRTAPLNLDKGRISLEKRQTVSLVKTGAAPLREVIMGLGWDPAPSAKNIDLDASVIAFDAGGKDVDRVWFMSKQGCKGAIRHSGDNLTGAGEGDDEQIKVDLSRIPAEVTALVFTVNSFSGQKLTEVRSAYARLVDNSGSELVRFSLTDSGAETGVIMCTMRRAGSSWTMTAIGDYHHGRNVRAMTDPARAWLRANPQGTAP